MLKFYSFGFLLWIVSISNSLHASGCNGRLLDMHTDGLVSKLWNRSTITVEDIKNTFNFVSTRSPSTSSAVSLDPILEKSQPFAGDVTFSHFTANCRQIYEDSQDAEEKWSLYLLLDAVIQKYSKTHKLLQKSRRFAEEELRLITNHHQSPTLIGTADRSAPLMTSQTFPLSAF